MEGALDTKTYRLLMRVASLSKAWINRPRHLCDLHSISEISTHSRLNVSSVRVETVPWLMIRGGGLASEGIPQLPVTLKLSLCPGQWRHADSY